MYAYAHARLSDETHKHTGVSSGDKLSAFIRGLLVLKLFQKQLRNK